MSVNLTSVLKANGLSMKQAAEICGVDKSLIVKVVGQNYHNWQQKEKELISAIQDAGYHKTGDDLLTINTDVLVKTSNVSRFFDLADDLANPDSSLSSSLGMAIGTAERGKTHAAKHYCRRNENAVYTLYVDGFSRVQLLRNICAELVGSRPYSFGACVSIIQEVSRVNRRLIIIDEADKCPLSILEMLRGLNESCEIPILLVGEEALKGKVDAVPRLRSRIRKPICVFESLSISDVSVYYSAAAGLSLDQPIIENLYRRARGGFRTLTNDSLALAKIARSSGLNTITPAMLDQLA